MKELQESWEKTLRELGGLQGAARTLKGAGLPRAGFKILLAQSEALPDVSEALPAASKSLPARFEFLDLYYCICPLSPKKIPEKFFQVMKLFGQVFILYVHFGIL